MIEKEFAGIFDAAPQAVVKSPGRVNIIGEHIDYNGGLVLPMGLPLGITVAISPRSDNEILIASDRFEGTEERKLGDPLNNSWADYAAGAIEFAAQENILKNGANIYVKSTMPDGAGLSSSAALIVGILKAARSSTNHEISNVEVAQLARRVENEYIGMPCGIMDQMAVAVAGSGEAIKLDTKTLDYALIEIPSAYHMAVIHSGIHRKLADGRYAARKEECDAAGAALGNDELCLLSEDQKSAAKTLPEPLRRRVAHCLSEHQRVLATARALENDDMLRVGALMNESHVSMRDDFEMSLPEIDALVESACDLGAVGARLTGGGFGGCIVAAVQRTKLDAWKPALLAKHPAAKFIC